MMVIEYQKVFSLTEKLAGLMNLIPEAASLYLALLRTDIIVYSIPTTQLNNLKFELIIYNMDLAIIRESRWLTPSTIADKSFSTAVVTITGSRANEISIKKRLVAFFSTFKIEK